MFIYLSGDQIPYYKYVKHYKNDILEKIVKILEENDNIDII